MSNHDELKGLGASWLLVSGELAICEVPEADSTLRLQALRPGVWEARLEDGDALAQFSADGIEAAIGRVVRLLLAKRPARTERAVALVSSGNGPVRVRGDVWRAPSQTGGGDYRVVPSAGWCSCPDRRYRGAWCKHLRAVALMTGAE